MLFMFWINLDCLIRNLNLVFGELLTLDSLFGVEKLRMCIMLIEMNLKLLKLQ